ncbi:efflux RND transporter periplasmic adaptor subunit [Amycolatopsis sp. CA-230715]|uniref:efflux RND transporter periplasmic adaptor subunit n=1 Tax=Amycolatopsis sp. CA-230715 TaxID=2745196 RepID=UPI001C012EC6|nr:HlyD family efflux transporter periplasmic adaptor subunit [Amycolatopsis sp. CA-230715]QWF79887.1 Macrolide export protein MacA [Amycolatopsis sp. CA-230715]
MSKRRAWLVNGVLVVLLGAAGFGIYQAFSPAQGTAQPQSRSTPVVRGDVAETVSAAGAVASGYSANVNFAESGKVTSIPVSVGDKVTAGERLATIDSAQASKQLEIAKDGLAVAKENLANANAAAPTTAPTKTGTSPQSAQQAESTTSLQAKVDQADLDVETAQAALDATVLTAPGAGTVTAINGAVGQQAGSQAGSGASSGTQQGSASGGQAGGQSGGAQGGQQGAATQSASGSGFIVLTDLDHLVVDTAVAEIDASKVKAGQKAQVTINAMPDTPVQASVASVALTPTTSGNTVSYDTKLTLTGAPAGLRPGQSASVVITVAEAADALTVPSAAVQTSGMTNTVVVAENGQNVPTPVQVGIRGESTVQITSGLTEGQRVVVTGAQQTAGGSRGGGQGGFPGGGQGGFPGTGGGGPRQAGGGR